MLYAYSLDGLFLHLNINTSLLECVHTFGLLGTFWHGLLSCRRSTSLDCQIQTYNSW